MSNSSDQNKELDDLLSVDEMQEKQKRVLARLLDSKIQQQDKHAAIRGHMGCIMVGPTSKANAIPSYSAMHSIDWVSRLNVLMGSEMDFMRNMVDPDTGKIVVDEESAEEMKQRAPDWSRQAELATYLIQENLRKFGTILAVISPPWIDDPNHENWGKDGRAIVSAADFEPMDSEGSLGLLDLSGAAVYALDGQHRVMGIRGIRELLEGGLNVKSKANQVKKTIPKDEFLTKVGKDVGDLHRILTEQINIEYIPAVLMGETKEEASRRVRSVFVAINSYAKKTEKGENILLSENDGFAIVARHVAHNSLLKTNEGTSRVNWKTATLRASEEVQVTTLAALRNFVQIYNKYTKKFDWEPLFKGVLPLRPSADEIDELTECCDDFLKRCRSLPVFKRVAAGDDLRTIREFPEDGSGSSEGHLLVRPIGIPILADAVGQALVDQALDLTFSKLGKFDSEGGFSCHRTDSIFYGLTYDPTSKKMRAQQGNQDLAARALKYLLVGGNTSERSELEQKIREQRRVGETDWIDKNGAVKKVDSDNYELPHPIQL